MCTSFALAITYIGYAGLTDQETLKKLSDKVITEIPENYSKKKFLLLNIRLVRKIPLLNPTRESFERVLLP